MVRIRPNPSDLSTQSREARRRALEALSLMREHGLHMTPAARRAGTTVRTMKRHLGPTLQKRPDRRYRAKAWDRMPRRMRFLTSKGRIELEVRDSRSAARLARYWTALDQALKKGEWWRLRPFRRKTVCVDGIEYPFITDQQILIRLGYAGEFQFEELYAQAS